MSSNVKVAAAHAAGSSPRPSSSPSPARCLPAAPASAAASRNRRADHISHHHQPQPCTFWSSTTVLLATATVWCIMIVGVVLLLLVTIASSDWVRAGCLADWGNQCASSHSRASRRPAGVAALTTTALLWFFVWRTHHTSTRADHDKIDEDNYYHYYLSLLKYNKLISISVSCCGISSIQQHKLKIINTKN